MQAVLHLEQFLDFTFHQAADRDAGPPADDLGDILGIDLFFEQFAVCLQLRQLLLFLFDPLLKLDDRPVLQLSGTVLVVLPLRLLDLVAGLIDLIARSEIRLNRLALLIPA